MKKMYKTLANLEEVISENIEDEHAAKINSVKYD